jgi:hypothetical protein
VGTAHASAPDSTVIAVNWCPSPPTNPGKLPGTRPPIHPAAVHKCNPGVRGGDGSVSGPDGGGTDYPGNSAGGIDTGDGSVCVGDEIVCHQPF